MMSRPMSSTNASLRYSSTSQQATVLAMRIESKKAELENLKQLRDLSNALAGQMHALEEKLATLKDGTESIACVLANWDNVLQAISMATTKATRLGNDDALSDSPATLPATLVRIPSTQGGGSSGE